MEREREAGRGDLECGRDGEGEGVRDGVREGVCDRPRGVMLRDGGDCEGIVAERVG